MAIPSLPWPPTPSNLWLYHLYLDLPLWATCGYTISTLTSHSEQLVAIPSLPWPPTLRNLWLYHLYLDLPLRATCGYTISTLTSHSKQLVAIPSLPWPPTQRNLWLYHLYLHLPLRETCGYTISTLTSHSEQLVATAIPSPPTQSNLCQILATELLAATIISLTITSGPHTYFTHMNANTYTHWDKPESNVIVIESILKLTDMGETVSELFMKPSVIVCL